MVHDKRDDGGMYRCCTPAETRASRARDLSQTHEGLFTHTRVAAERRMPLAVTQLDAKRFVDHRVNRTAYRPKVSK